MVHQKKQNHGVERRFTDDMSELDIQLQEQTSEVSVSEMMQEADSIKKVLEQNTKNNQEDTREDEYNGK